MARRPFLTARWENLAIVSYAVDEGLLTPHLPRGLELDRHEGRVFVSLVAFDFRDTRVFGVRWLRCVNFPEINLRYYVRDPAAGRRGVCFIRELVQCRPVIWIARCLYNEPYYRACMSSRVARDDRGLSIVHVWSCGGGEHSLRVRASSGASLPPATSVEHWFKEHEWGFGRDRRGRALTYRVQHPAWEVYRVESLNLRVDFGALYGTGWTCLNGREPDSVILAAGSAVAVFPKERGRPGVLREPREARPLRPARERGPPIAEKRDWGPRTLPAR